MLGIYTRLARSRKGNPESPGSAQLSRTKVRQRVQLKRIRENRPRTAPRMLRRTGTGNHRNDRDPLRTRASRSRRARRTADHADAAGVLAEHRPARRVGEPSSARRRPASAGPSGARASRPDGNPARVGLAARMQCEPARRQASASETTVSNSYFPPRIFPPTNPARWFFVDVEREPICQVMSLNAIA